jgi:hypothetical protein
MYFLICNKEIFKVYMNVLTKGNKIVMIEKVLRFNFVFHYIIPLTSIFSVIDALSVNDDL